jgi:hypothetical protein
MLCFRTVILRAAASKTRPAWVTLSLIWGLRLYLTDFLNRIFSGENALSRAFGRENDRARFPFTIPGFTMAQRCKNQRFIDPASWRRRFFESLCL